MKRFLVCVVCLLSVRSLSYGTGLGLMVGEPNGISAKIWSGEKIGYACALSSGWSGGLYLHGDYLMHNKNLISGIPVYYGLGLLMSFSGGDRNNSHNFWLGVRLPLGIDYFFAGNEFDVFLELVPTLNVVPFGFGFGGGLGLRYNF